jgi:heterodisulfide reductase subunit B
VSYSYFPGCSLHGSSKNYDYSTRSVCEALGIELKELPDWICCGASSGHSLSSVLNVGLPAQNLKIAEEIGLDIVVPCAACYNRLKSSAYRMSHDESVREQVESLLNFQFKNSTAILNLVELIQDRIGLDAIQSKIVQPLKGLKVACYYGCLLVRPVEVTEFDDPEDPRSLDEIMEILEAKPVNWSYKTECCGGSLSLSREDVCIHLVDKIIDMAKEAGAEAIVTACPLCMENLEMRQTDPAFPIFYFTELLGLALGLKESLNWFKQHMVNPNAVLKSAELIT